MHYKNLTLVGTSHIARQSVDEIENVLEKKNTKKDKKNSIKIAKDKGSTVVKEDS